MPSRKQPQAKHQRLSPVRQVRTIEEAKEKVRKDARTASRDNLAALAQTQTAK